MSGGVSIIKHFNGQNVKVTSYVSSLHYFVDHEGPNIRVRMLFSLESLKVNISNNEQNGEAQNPGHWAVSGQKPGLFTQNNLGSQREREGSDKKSQELSFCVGSHQN